MENINLIIIEIFTLAGVFLGFLFTFLKEKHEEKEKLKIWKMIIYVELKEQRKKNLYMKDILKKENPPTLYSKLMFDGTIKYIYNYNFINKVLGKNFNIYSKYIKSIE